MNKKLSPLEALEKIDNTVCLNHLAFGVDKYDHCDCRSIEDFVDCYDTIEKSLKAFEIIKVKEVDWFSIKYTTSVELYNYRMKTSGFTYAHRLLTKEEYDLLKEELDNVRL